MSILWCRKTRKRKSLISRSSHPLPSLNSSTHSLSAINGLGMEGWGNEDGWGDRPFHKSNKVMNGGWHPTQGISFMHRLEAVNGQHSIAIFPSLCSLLSSPTDESRWSDKEIGDMGKRRKGNESLYSLSVNLPISSISETRGRKVTQLEIL